MAIGKMSRSTSLRKAPSERSPLLVQSPEEDQLPSPPPYEQPTRWRSAEGIQLFFMLLVLLVSLGDAFSETPQTRITESVICYRYYEKVDPTKLNVGREAVGPGAIGGVDEMWCKADQVQAELAVLRGWQQLFDAIPALLLALPVGWAADKYGRKPFMFLGLLAFNLRATWIQLVLWFWQAFNIRALWFSTLFGSVGGGNAVTITLVFVVLSDITLESQRAGAFLRVGAFNLLAALIMPPLAALLMTINPWIPSITGTLMQVATTILFLFFPETLGFRHPGAPPRPPFSRRTTAQSVASRRSTTRTTEQMPPTLITKAFNNLKASTTFLTADYRVPILISPFLLHMMIGMIGQLLLQYLSKRYEIKLSKAIMIFTIRNAVVTGLLFFILPWASTTIMRRYNLSAQRKDLYLMRVSMVFLAVGWTLVGLSPNIPLAAISLAIASMGQGAILLLRSFLTGLVEKHHVARLYSVISVVDTTGSMVGSPLMAGLFQRGLHMGGLWIGMPFYFLGIMSALFTILQFAIGLRKGEDEDVLEDEQEGEVQI